MTFQLSVQLHSIRTHTGIRIKKKSMKDYSEIKQHLAGVRYRWLITGVAGFIGSNLLETLLSLNQEVTGLDNFSSGYRHNLDEVRDKVGEEAWSRFRFIAGDIRNVDDCRHACEGVQYVLHQAALCSVPASIEDPFAANEINITGFLNILTAARGAKAKRFVYAASSATYGDHPGLPKRENEIGNQLSPYALTKYVNELYAGVFARCYGTESIGLRYFNVFGPRQDPNGAYAAVIPQWIAALIEQRVLQINGDGETTRDFCFVDNVVQANLLSALTTSPDAVNQIYNVAVGERTSLNQLYASLRSLLLPDFPKLADHRPKYADFREGDVRHSQADISKAVTLLGFKPTHRLHEGLEVAMSWYKKRLHAPA